MGRFYVIGFSNSSVIYANRQSWGDNWQIIQPVFVGVKMIQLFFGLLTDRSVVFVTMPFVCSARSWKQRGKHEKK